MKAYIGIKPRFKVLLDVIKKEINAYSECVISRKSGELVSMNLQKTIYFDISVIMRDLFSLNENNCFEAETFSLKFEKLQTCNAE